MNYKDIRIIFMGTPEFAVVSLDKLVNAGFNIVAVITAPDKPAGRGMEMQFSAVKKYAVEKGLMVLQPEKLKDPNFIEQLKSLKADLQIVVAFRMLPEIVWNMPPMGTLNLHGSLLPQYRGAAPINWAIINGEAYTGVTTFKLKHEIDTGDILLTEKIPLTENEIAGTLHDKMKVVGADLLLKTVIGLSENSIVETPQNHKDLLKNAPKIFTENCIIDWNKTAVEINQLIKGLSPYPAAFTHLNEKKLKIFSAEIEWCDTSSMQNGTHQTDGKNYLKFSCADGFLIIKDLQLEGKKRMPISDFLRGYRFN
jgi:methionyl-tRNA formyltransferase